MIRTSIYVVPVNAHESRTSREIHSIQVRQVVVHILTVTTVPPRTTTEFGTITVDVVIVVTVVCRKRVIQMIRQSVIY